MIDRKAKRKRRHNGFIDILNGLLTLLVLGLVVAVGAFFFGASQFYGDGPAKEETTFRVESGSGLGLTSERLEAQGLISNKYIFQVVGRVTERSGNIKAGDFRIPAGASMDEILRELTEGTPIRYAVTIPEGWTAWQVFDRLEKTSDLTGGIANMPAEGSILPGSYDYIPGDTRQSVLDKMQAAMAEELAKAWAGRRDGLPLENPEQLLVLASIVERETGLSTERPQVAAVFVNRLNEGMRLQSDPTIIYGITKGQTTLDRGLRRSEIDQKTPYNTYQIDGLPPTAIANPGRESLAAVANPDEHKYLYFVAKGANPSEGHAFAETYDEHRQNVARYREIVRAASERAETEAVEARDAIEAQEANEAGGAPATTTP